MAPESLLTHNPGPGGSGLPSVLPPPMDCCVDRVYTARNLLFLYIFFNDRRIILKEKNFLPMLTFFSQSVLILEVLSNDRRMSR
jgi:hypothetical protein